MIITIINVPKSALAVGFSCNEYHKTSLKKIFAGFKLASGGKCSYSVQQECEKMTKYCFQRFQGDGEKGEMERSDIRFP